MLKSEAEIAYMREAGRIVADILAAMAAEVAPGVPTMRFEEIAQDLCSTNKVKPAFQGYMGFPFALCCAVNEEVVHGFPSARRLLVEGDIISFDMGVMYQGFYGDSARTVGVGQVSPQAAKLMRVTEECLYKAIDAAKPGNTINDIAMAVQKHGEAAGFSIIRRFVGHGIGSNLHEKPEIPNYVTTFGCSTPLKTGMVLAIEPMLAIGTKDVVILPDNWTANTKDGSLAAHWEHSVAVTHGEAEILSLSENGPKMAENR